MSEQVTIKQLAVKFGLADESSGVWEGRFNTEQLAMMINFLLANYSRQIKEAAEFWMNQKAPDESSKKTVNELMLFLTEQHLL